MNPFHIFITTIIATAVTMMAMTYVCESRRETDRAKRFAENEERARVIETLFYAQEVRYDEEKLEAWKRIQELRASKSQGWEIKQD